MTNFVRAFVIALTWALGFALPMPGYAAADLGKSRPPNILFILCDDLGINDTEVAVTFTVPNFLTTGQPLFISPAFALHLWDGPSFMPADLPPNAYSAYLDAQWASDPNLQIGAELGFRIGVYTDFKTLNEHSLRIQGLGLGIFRLTPTLTAKLGAMYIDRNDIKILPAGGLLWTPTPQVRFDIFFPQPKLSSYLTTVGRYELSEVGHDVFLTIQQIETSREWMTALAERNVVGKPFRLPREFAGPLSRIV